MLVFTATYVKLQDAYASESGAVGSWKLIGYIAPGAKDKDSKDKAKYSTNVFDYTDEFKGADKNTTMVANLDDYTEGWKAEAKTALNDCGIQSTWALTMKAAGNGDALSYKAEIDAKGTDASEDDCLSLTANFKTIAHN